MVLVSIARRQLVWFTPLCVRRAGAAAVRPYWTKYVTTDTRALIWVLDGSDPVRLEEASSALRSLLATEARLRGAPLLVLLNKTELGGDEAVTVGEATAALGLAQAGERVALVLQPAQDWWREEAGEQPMQLDVEQQRHR